jgi:hypothetical protein
MADFSWGNIVDSIGGGIGASLRGDGSQSNAMKRRAAMAAAETGEDIEDESQRRKRGRVGEEDVYQEALNRQKKQKKSYEDMLGEEELLKLGLVSLEEQYGNFSVKPPQGIGEMFGFDREAKKRRDQMVQRQQMQDNLLRQQVIAKGKNSLQRQRDFTDSRVGNFQSGMSQNEMNKIEVARARKDQAEFDKKRAAYRNRSK